MWILQQNSKVYFVLKNGFNAGFKISYIEVQIRIRFGMVDSINTWMQNNIKGYSQKLYKQYMMRSKWEGFHIVLYSFLYEPKVKLGYVDWSFIILPLKCICIHTLVHVKKQKSLERNNKVHLSKSFLREKKRKYPDNQMLHRSQLQQNVWTYTKIKVKNDIMSNPLPNSIIVS